MLLNSLKSNWQMAAFRQWPIHLLLSITASNRNASDCQLPVANSKEFENRHLAAVLLAAYSAVTLWKLSKRIDILLPVANCQFARTVEEATRWFLVVIYSPVILYNCLKSNWQLTARWQLPIHKNLRNGIWLPFACCLFRCYAVKHYQIEFASDCKLPVANSQDLQIGIWLPFAGFIFSFNRLKPSQLELASGC